MLWDAFQGHVMGRRVQPNGPLNGVRAWWGLDFMTRFGPEKLCISYNNNKHGIEIRKTTTKLWGCSTSTHTYIHTMLIGLHYGAAGWLLMSHYPRS